MVKRSLTFAAIVGLLALFALAGCGGGHHVTIKVAHPCNTGDYAMNCVTPKTSHIVSPRVAVIANGIDFAWSCPSPSGRNFGASYLSLDASKNWTRGCVNAWHAAGAKTVAVWESSSTRAQDGFAAGQTDARAAAAQASALGEPSNRPIFFAVDFDTSGFSGPVSFPIPTITTIYSYFRGVDSVLGVNRTGGYGGITTIGGLFNQRLIGYGWQAYAWSHGQWDSRAQLRQVLNSSSVDYDQAVDVDYGQWPYVPAPVLPVCFHKREAASTCAAAKAKIASDLRAVASSQRAYSARGCPAIRQRRNWFYQHIHKPPASRRAYRTAAYNTSVRAYVRQSCPTFGGWQATGGRIGFFTGLAMRLQAAN